VVTIGEHDYMLAVLVQGNCGALAELRVDGVPVGRELQGIPSAWERPARAGEAGDGSIIIVIATDAPLSERQLGRLCRRGMLGLARACVTR
jgi:D-aminopeptidase